MRLRYREKILIHGPIAASAVLLTLGSLNSDCGVRNSPLTSSAVSFEDSWRYKAVLLEDATGTRCLEMFNGQCRLTQKETGHAVTQKTYEGCWIRQEFEAEGDAVVLGCEACAADGSSMEIFRVNSSQELYGTESEIIDRDDAEKRFLVLAAYGSYGNCANYFSQE